MTSTQWIIKLLSGSHAGAEMLLENRNYLAGQADECDIVLHDASMPKKAFNLNVTEDGIQLECLNANLVVNGQPTNETNLNVKTYEVYSLGLLHFCFGMTNTSWPEINIPIEAEDKASPIGDASVIKGSHSKKEKRHIGWVGRPHIILNLAIFLVFVVGSLLFNTRQLDARIVESTSVIDLADIVARQWDFPNLSVSPIARSGNPSHWLISGYVQTANDAVTLKQFLQTVTVDVELDIRIMERIKQSTQTLLKQFGLEHLTVSIGKQPGELLIQGVVKNIDHWQRQKALLLTDIPGLINLVDKVETPETRLALLKQWIQEEDLDNAVFVDATNGHLTITSDNSLVNSARWQRIKKRFHARFGESLDLTNVSVHRPAIKIRSVSLGEFPYLVLADGRRYGLGAHIRDDYYLEQIREDIVVLKRGEEQIKYRIGPGEQ